MIRKYGIARKKKKKTALRSEREWRVFRLRGEKSTGRVRRKTQGRTSGTGRDGIRAVPA